MTDAERQTAYHESIWKPEQRKCAEYWQSMWERSMHNPKNQIHSDDVVMPGDLPYPENPKNTWTGDPWKGVRGSLTPPNEPCCKEGLPDVKWDPSLKTEESIDCLPVEDPFTAARNEAKFSDKDLEGFMAQELGRILALFRERQAKYGPKNIAEFGEVGVLVRLYDKLARLRNFYFDGGVGDMADESVEDAWSDISCYAAIALVCKRGRWPGATPSRTPKDAL